MKSLVMWVIMLLGITALTLLAVEKARRDNAQSAPIGSVPSEQSKDEIKKVLADQQKAWNRGDLESFMEGYLKSPDIVFTSEGVVYYGWQVMLDRYKKNYARENMGQLTFEVLNVNLLAEDAAAVLGRWNLKRAQDELQGIFTLIFRRTPQGWRIIHDHTSRKTAR